MKSMRSRRRSSLLAAAIALTACAQPDMDIIARELYGTWTTDAKEYAGRGFALTADSVTLHQGGGVHVTYAIERIRRTERDTHTAYIVTYFGAVGPLDFPLEFRAGEEDPHLRFPNQPHVIWMRDTTSVPSGGG